MVALVAALAVTVTMLATGPTPTTPEVATAPESEPGPAPGSDEVDDTEEQDADDTDGQASEQASEADAPGTDVAQNGDEGSTASTLGLTPDELAEQWNAVADQRGSSLTLLTPLDVSVGSGGATFHLEFGDFAEDLAMLGSVSHPEHGGNGELTMVMLSAVPSDTTAALQTIEAFELVVAAIRPDLSSAERDRVLEALGVPHSFTEEGHSADHAVGGVDFSLSLLEGMGWTLFAGADSE